ncbi:MAG: hypothetical protein RL708_2094 [Bacteroidota bacterium]
MFALIFLFQFQNVFAFEKLKDSTRVIIYDTVETMPKFSKDDTLNQLLFAFISQNINYPRDARENDVQGVVNVSFVVLSDGSISSIEFKKDIGYGFAQEAVRILKKMPTWIPGKHKGKPVAVRIKFPIRFSLG